MKKQILSLSFIATAAISFGQGIVLVDETNSSVITPGTNFTVNGTVTDTDLNYDLVTVVNNTGTTTKLNMRRYEITAPAGTKNYFCWYVCLGEVYQGQYPVYNHSTGSLINVSQGDSLNLFSGHHKPMGNSGTATYRYVVYDINNVNDSTYFDVTFNIALGVNEKEMVNEINLYPNPANSYVKLDYEFNNSLNSDKQLVICDVLGNKVKDLAISNSKGLITIDIHSLKAGIYFYSFLVDGKAIETRRLVIQH